MIHHRTLALGLAWILVGTPLPAHAEGAGPQGPSDLRRVRGVVQLVPMDQGLVTIGGRKLRYLPPGSRRWKTLWSQKGHLSMVGVDPEGGRVLAAWEKDPRLHFVDVPTGRHRVLNIPKPQLPEDQRYYRPYHLSFSPNGRDAIVTMYAWRGPTGANTLIRTFRIPLDKSPARLIFESDAAAPKWLSPRGGIFQLPTDAEAPCGTRACHRSQLVAVTYTPTGSRRRVLAGPKSTPFSGVRRIPGGGEDGVVLVLHISGGGETALRFDWEKPEPDLFPLATKPNQQPGTRVGVNASLDEILYLAEDGTQLKVVRHALKKPEPKAPAPAAPEARPPNDSDLGARLRNIKSVSGMGLGASLNSNLPVRRIPWLRSDLGKVYGKGVRADGSVWLHRGDSVLLVDDDGAREVKLLPLLKSMVGDRPEWAGSAQYVAHPERLWIGVEVGAGRDFVSVHFEALETQSIPWVAPPLPPRKEAGRGMESAPSRR